MVRRGHGFDSVYGASGEQAFQLRYGAELAELEGGYDGWVDAGACVVTEFFVRVRPPLPSLYRSGNLVHVKKYRGIG